MAKLAASEAATYISHQVFPIFLLLFNEKLIYNPTMMLPVTKEVKLLRLNNFHVQTDIPLFGYQASSFNFGLLDGFEYISFQCG